MKNPKVSIVIPSFKPQHFEMCLRSAIGQSYLNTEILVSDNCQTEEIKNICNRYISDNIIYQRSSVFREENVKSALAGAKGELIKPLFDDDLLHPFCIERMVAAINSNSDIQLVFSSSQVIDFDNQRTQMRRPFQTPGTLLGPEALRISALGMVNFVGEFSTVMFRRDRLWDVGLHKLFKMGDHDFTFGLADLISYINLAENGKLFYLDEELSYFWKDSRLLSNSNASSNPFFGNCFSDWIDLLRVSLDNNSIDSIEYKGMSQRVDSLFERYNKLYPQIGESRLRYYAKINI